MIKVCITITESICPFCVYKDFCNTAPTFNTQSKVITKCPFFERKKI